MGTRGGILPHNFFRVESSLLYFKVFLCQPTVNRDVATAMAFLNKMGGTHSTVLSDLAVQVWNWCIKRNIHIHVEHLPKVENIRADWESCHMKDAS